MATQLFFRSGAGANSDYSTGNNDPYLAGGSGVWVCRALATTRGSLVDISSPTNTVAGPTNGIEIQDAAIPAAFYSPPLAAAVTIAGSITWNLWASENNMSANVAINGILEVVDGATGAITLIDKTARTTEVAVTTRAVNNFAETPAAGVACKKGDRLRVRIFGDDAGTMASGFNFNASWNGGTAGADGDSYLTLTENLTFVSEPAGSQVFLTDTASDVATASVDREAWTARGAGAQTDVTNTVAGWTAPVQVTDTAGGTVVDWFTRPLAAFTLGGAVRCNIWCSESHALANAASRVEIAVVNSDGSSPVLWGGTTAADEAPWPLDPEDVHSFLVSGVDVAVSAGQRLRIRVLVDDCNFDSGGEMGSGWDYTLYYAGTSGGASGDSYLRFTQTLTEFVSAAETGQQQIIGGGYMPTYARAFLDHVKRRYWRSGWERRPSGVLVPA